MLGRTDGIRIAEQECSEELAVSGLVRESDWKNWQFQDCRIGVIEKIDSIRIVARKRVKRNILLRFVPVRCLAQG